MKTQGDPESDPESSSGLKVQNDEAEK